MKKTTIIISVLLLAAIFITACGAAGSEISGELADNVAVAAEDSNAPADAAQADVAGGVQEQLAEGEMSLSLKLTLGTFKLDETAR
jgi:ABC-type oligopeptide transport system substrate-binding subunit